ncbi:hypothetical protein [Amycolatopsis sp.]|uniref:hypothetical protein n=1 Tax=Amycolatopsis sp. TaxID=37632 RepID=UPI002DF85D96|nr:hypothetical protein [Amycolatopsis sp.]
MRLNHVPGITRVALTSVRTTTDELLALLGRLRGPDAARDPGLEVAALQAAELAHQHETGLLAVVEHADADPAILVAGLIAVARPLDPDSAAELGYHLADTGGPGIREVTRAETERGYPVVLAERVQTPGAQLQAVVVDPERPRIVVFTLHSPTARGWLEVAGIAGRFVAGIDLSVPARVP